MYHPRVHLVLASRSLRRADLLTNAGYEFEIAPADIDERLLDGETPAVHVRRLARDKAAHVARDHPGAIVLGADTVVVIDAVMLGKPADEADAAGMLRSLSGRTHEVLTGVALLSPSDQRGGVELTRVTFRELTTEDVAWHVASGEPDGKAGAYAIQGRASRFVTRIEGSYANVVGLPVALVDHLLEEIAGRASWQLRAGTSGRSPHA